MKQSGHDISVIEYTVRIVLHIGIAKEVNQTFVF